MQFSLLSLALFAGAALAGPAEPVPATRCNADNCARALTGTAFGLTRSSTRVADCATFQTCTAVPAVTTISTTCTTTAPAYITTACQNSAAYASACSCAGQTTAVTTTTVPTPASVPATFKIAVKSSSGTTLAYLGTDGQTYGNIGAPVLSSSSAAGAVLAPAFRLDGTKLLTVEGTPRAAYSFDGEASKLYFVDASAPAPTFDIYTFKLYSCSLGAFDGTVPGYPLTCVNAKGFSDVFIQTGTQNYGTGQVGFSESAPIGPDVFGFKFYAVQL